jgi:biopolymer transport protein ExbB/TolQ
MNESLSAAIAGLVVAVTALVWSWIQHRQITKIVNGEERHGKKEKSNKDSLHY